VHGKRGSTVWRCGDVSDATGRIRFWPASDPQSDVSRANVAQTCGRPGSCHVGVTEKYSASIHGQQLAAGSTKARFAPIATPPTHHTHQHAAFCWTSSTSGGTCHDKPPAGSKSKLTLYETYRQSYHGQVNKLGVTRAARLQRLPRGHEFRSPPIPSPH